MQTPKVAYITILLSLTSPIHGLPSPLSSPLLSDQRIATPISALQIHNNTTISFIENTICYHSNIQRRINLNACAPLIERLANTPRWRTPAIWTRTSTGSLRIHEQLCQLVLHDGKKMDMFALADIVSLIFFQLDWFQDGNDLGRLMIDWWTV